MQVTPSQWGNSLGIRLPKEIVRQAGIEKGKPLELTMEGGKIVLAAAKRKVGRSGLTMEELLSGMTHESMREAAAEVDWGPDVGREIIDD